MNVTGKCSAAALVLAMASSGAQAAKVFDAGVDLSNANCSFNTVCGPATDSAGSYAAQLFSLSAETTIKSASYVILNEGVDLPTAANWKILAADGVAGLPGTVVASGTSALLPYTRYLGWSVGYRADIQYFDLSGITLNSGSYYFAVQAEAPSFHNFLVQGGLSTGAAEYLNGQWYSSYKDMGSVSISLYDSVAVVPEPTTYAMLLGGLALLGVAARRRKSV